MAEVSKSPFLRGEVPRINPARGRADDREEFSEEARRQDALGRGVEALAPNETEATLTPNALGANQAANFFIEQRIPQDAEVSGDLSGRQELGSGVELR